MKKLKLIITALLFVNTLISVAQLAQNSPNPKLIAVVNRANWCAVCKANGERFGTILSSFSTQGVNIYINDLTDEKTKETSKQALEKDNIYKAVNTIPRKGMGKALKSCGLVKDKEQTTDVAGIVTFIDPKTHKQLKQLSLAETDEEMKKNITKLLK